MTINLNVKIKAGPRTSIKVEVYGTAVNEKVIRFANGRIVSGENLAEFLEEKLKNMLHELAAED